MKPENDRPEDRRGPSAPPEAPRAPEARFEVVPDPSEAPTDLMSDLAGGGTFAGQDSFAFRLES